MTINFNSDTILHDVLKPGLNLVICGTAVGDLTAASGNYYAHPSNKFWSMLHQLGLTPYCLQPSEYLLLPNFRIGLTDLVKNQHGNDDTIKFHQEQYDALRKKILKFKPTLLCFNGKKAAKIYFDTRYVEYGLRAEKIGQTKIYIAPSTSGAASRWWNIDLWRQAAQLILRK